jgi:hypothetical protein
MFAFGNILNDPHHPAYASRITHAMLSGRPNPPNLTIHAPDTALEIPIGVRGHGFLELRVHHLAVLGEHVLDKHLVGPLREELLVAEDTVMLEGPVGGMIYQVEIPGTGVAGFKREAQQLFTFAQCLFGPLSLFNITSNMNTSSEFFVRIV